MLGKSLRYAILFLFLFVANLIIINKSYNYTQRQAHAQRILKEIAQITDPQNQFQFSGNPYVLGTYETNATLGDSRAANLKSFFRKYNSPLYDFAELIVSVSDEYGFDYRLLPAIAMQESNLCKYIPDDSHNCWGWGIYGSTVTKFSSYDEAIQAVARGVRRNYIDKGLVTASAIMEKYTPSSTGSWAHGVNTFLRALE